MKIKICIIAWRRPYYFKEIIHALEQCHDLDQHSLLISIDGGYPDRQQEHEEIFSNSSLTKLNKYELFLQPENMGCAGNMGSIQEL